MKVINSEYFSSYRENGCVIEQMQYDYDCILDCYCITFVFNNCKWEDDNSNHRIKFTAVNPSDMYMYHITNLSPICELEMIDYLDDGYLPENRYYIHDIEDDNLKFYFSDYEIEIVD